MKHTCHVPGCKAGCPPKHLFCAPHWGMVSALTQREVYRTVKLRAKGAVNETWAPWWRAQATATDEVLTRLYPGEPWVQKRLAKDMAFAEMLEETDDRWIEYGPGQKAPVVR
jgi:hypothetical protein